MSNKHILYRIYYDNCLVYLCRTNQPLQNRIRGHLFKKPMHRVINIDQVTKIEYCEFDTIADMYLYEIYFINLYKPPLNVDDKARDDLTVKLPDVEWKLGEFPLWDKWKEEIRKSDDACREAKDRMKSLYAQRQNLRNEKHAGNITEDEYWDKLNEINCAIDKFQNENKTFLF